MIHSEYVKNATTYLMNYSVPLYIRFIKIMCIQLNGIKWPVQFYKETSNFIQAQNYDGENTFLFLFFVFDELINGFQHYEFAIGFQNPVEFSIHYIFVLSLRGINGIFLLKRPGGGFFCAYKNVHKFRVAVFEFDSTTF